MRTLNLFMIADHCAPLPSLTHPNDFETLEDLNNIRYIDPNETLCEIASNSKYFYGNKTRGSKPMSDFSFNSNRSLPEKKAKSLSYIGDPLNNYIYTPSVNKNEYMMLIILTDMCEGNNNGFI